MTKPWLNLREMREWYMPTLKYCKFTSLQYYLNVSTLFSLILAFI